MRCPKCYTETPNDALNCPSCNLVTPKGRTAAPQKDNSAKSKKGKAGAKSKIDWGAIMPGKWITWVLLAGFLVGSGFLAYWYVYSTPQSVKPETALNAMNQLRRLPSKEEGKSIEDRMTEELKKAKDSGQLVKYKGWTVKPYNNHSYLVSFSYEETSSTKSADWIVDPQNNIFTPITELASSVHKQ
jgi:hypothetical protein